MDIKGTVTLNLADYHKLIEEQPKAEESRKNLYEASKEIEVFLSFLVTRDDIEDYVVEYNNQALHSTIEVKRYRTLAIEIYKTVNDLNPAYT